MSPVRASSSNALAGKLSGEIPPIVVNDEQPVLLDVRDRDADLVDVADERERRRAARPRATRANDEPSASACTSANAAAASRQTARRLRLVTRTARAR